MSSRIEKMSRQKAGDLLAIVREARTRGELLDVVLMDGSDWVHPGTRDKLARAEALEACLERMLTSRARP